MIFGSSSHKFAPHALSRPEQSVGMALSSFKLRASMLSFQFFFSPFCLLVLCSHMVDMLSKINSNCIEYDSASFIWILKSTFLPAESLVSLVMELLQGKNFATLLSCIFY